MQKNLCVKGGAKKKNGRVFRVRSSGKSKNDKGATKSPEAKNSKPK